MSEVQSIEELFGELRYFAGVPLKDAADLLGISPATAKRRWAFARAFLYGELADV
jgi:DNA-directed RNA polymerase specialized sigma24 family protein